MRRVWSSLALTVTLLSLAGCGLPDTTDIDVAVVGEDPSLNVAPAAFGPGTGVLTGGFTLSLRLGPEASQDTDVEVQSLKLVGAADSAELFTPAELEVGANAVRKVHVAVGQTQKIIYHLAYDKPVSITNLCKAGDIKYTGTVFDSARSKAIPIQGAAFKPVGCPG